MFACSFNVRITKIKLDILNIQRAVLLLFMERLISETF